MTIEHRVMVAERLQSPQSTRINSTPEFEHALFSFFHHVQEACCSDCTEELKAARSEFTGDVADLCFSDCLVFRDVERK